MFDGDEFPFVSERSLTLLGYLLAAVVLFQAGAFANEVWDSWAIEALGVAVSGVLTLALVQLYRRQTAIQDTQTEIMEYGFAPEIVVDSWTVGEADGKVSLQLMNLGNGVAKDIAIGTRVAPLPDSEERAIQIESDEPEFSWAHNQRMQRYGAEYQSPVLDNTGEKGEFRVEPSFRAFDPDRPMLSDGRGSFEEVTATYAADGFAAVLVYFELRYRSSTGMTDSRVFYGGKVMLPETGGVELRVALDDGTPVLEEFERTDPSQMS